MLSKKLDIPSRLFDKEYELYVSKLLNDIDSKFSTKNALLLLMLVFLSAFIFLHNEP